MSSATIVKPFRLMVPQTAYECRDSHFVARLFPDRCSKHSRWQLASSLQILALTETLPGLIASHEIQSRQIAVELV